MRSHKPGYADARRPSSTVYASGQGNGNIKGRAANPRGNSTCNSNNNRAQRLRIRPHTTPGECLPKGLPSCSDTSVTCHAWGSQYRRAVTVAWRLPQALEPSGELVCSRELVCSAVSPCLGLQPSGGLTMHSILKRLVAAGPVSVGTIPAIVHLGAVEQLPLATNCCS